MGLTASESIPTHAQPEELVGGGGTTYTYSTPYSTPYGSTPYGNGVCHETSYELGRFGLLGYCASAGPQTILQDIGGAICAVSGALTVIDAQNGEFEPTSASNIVGYLSCADSIASIAVSVIGSLSLHPIRDGVVPSGVS
jgi:hypothetical protein